MTFLKTLSCIAVLAVASFSMDSKTLMHVISVPVIEGAGVYSSVRCLQTDNTNNKAAAITNISLLGVNASLGALSMFGKEESYAKMRTTHRVVGFLVSGASMWLAISAARDDDVAKVDKGVAVGYTALTVVPILLFSF